MNRLRSSIQIARLVLVWFALSVGIAIASPLVKPESTMLVCTGSGMMKLVVTGDDSGKPSIPKLDCPLCATIGAPPPALNTALSQPSPLSHALLPSVAAHIASLTAPPLPSRGPPTFHLWSLSGYSAFSALPSFCWQLALKGVRLDYLWMCFCEKFKI